MKVFAATALMVLLLAGCSKPAAPPPFAMPPTPVTVVLPTVEDLPRYIDEIGRIAAREMVSIQPQVGGRITGLHFEDGADVKQGALLFSIDPRPYEAQLAAADAGIAQAQAALDIAKTEYDRVSKISDSRAVSKQDIDLKKNAVDVAVARLSQAKSAVDSAKLNLEYCSIRSPIEGRAGRRLADLGNIVDTNGPALLVVQRLDPVYADFSVPEQRLAQIRASLAAHPVAVELRLPDDAGPARAGELTFLDTGIQAATGTLSLRATAANADRHFWPGQFVRVRVVLETIKGAVLIPAAATQLSAMGPFVYVVKEDSTAELRPIVLGQRHGERVVVEQNLKAGERVVLEGHMGVMPGAKVNVVEPAAAPPGGKQ